MLVYAVNLGEKGYNVSDGKPSQNVPNNEKHAAGRLSSCGRMQPAGDQRHRERGDNADNLCCPMYCKGT